MPYSKFKTPEWILTFVAGFLVLGSWATSKAYNDAAAQVRQSIEVRRQANSLLVAVLSAETGQRGYLITGRNTYLDDYYRGIGDAPKILARLKELVNAEPVERTQVESLEREIRNKFEEMGQTIGLTKSGDKDRAYGVVEEDSGRRYMKVILHLLLEMKSHEDSKLEELYGSEVWWFRLMVTLLVLAGAALGASLYVAHNKYRKHLPWSRES